MALAKALQTIKAYSSRWMAEHGATFKWQEGYGGFTVGALVQCNFGLRRQLRIAGVPVGRELQVPEPCYDTREPLDLLVDYN